MRIAFCAPTDIHALARFSSQSTVGVAHGLGSTATTPLILELLRRGHEVTVYTLSKGLHNEETYSWGNLKIFVGPSRQRHLARNFYRPEISYLKRVIRTDAPAFVHAHWTYEFALAALRSGISTLTTIHDLPWKVLQYFRDPHRAVRLLMAYEVAFRGQHFTAVSEDAAMHFRRYLKPGAEIRVVPNGLPNAVFEISEHSAAKNHPGVTFATILQGWSRQKNPTAALEAFHILKHTIPDAQLLMFGLGYEQGGPAQQWAIQRHLDLGVTFAGPLPYHELLKRVAEEVDIVVHPSLDESFSMVAVEAMALKKPVIAGKSSTGVREVLGFGKYGILVDITDPKAIGQEMVRLACDTEFRDRVAQVGYQRASSLYRMETVATMYEELYSSIIRA